MCINQNVVPAKFYCFKNKEIKSINHHTKVNVKLFIDDVY